MSFEKKINMYLKKMTIHTIGDSHSFNGWHGVNIINHATGPVLCYSFGKEKLNRCNISGYDLNDGDTLIFCFGEIDCRCHIHKHITKNITYQQIIDNIVEHYMDAIHVNLNTIQVKLKYVCVFNVVPPIERHNTWENPEYPYLGSDEERKSYSLYFNKKLKEKCAENKFIFFDVYDQYTDENGFLKKELSDNNVHIKNGIHITEFVENYLL